jgi:hypothetical protein
MITSGFACIYTASLIKKRLGGDFNDIEQPIRLKSLLPNLRSPSLLKRGKLDKNV